MGEILRTLTGENGELVMEVRSKRGEVRFVDTTALAIGWVDLISDEKNEVNRGWELTKAWYEDVFNRMSCFVRIRHLGDPNEALRGKLTIGIERIAKERQRQIDEEGWTPGHDDEHQNNQMPLAAICYVKSALGWPSASKLWPPSWSWKWWTPGPDPIRDLEKAGALIAAEIDRREREIERVTAKRDLRISTDDFDPGSSGHHTGRWGPSD